MDATVSRRDFLRMGALSTGLAGLPLSTLGAGASRRAERCVVINLVGGPSGQETWDPKPNAPDRVRGPFKAIPTCVPGTWISELFPRLAERADRFALLRAVHHEAAPIHETGMQYLQSGRLAADGASPSWFARLSHRAGVPATLIPGPIESTGVSLEHGQSAAHLATPPIRFMAPSHLGNDGLLDLASKLLHDGTRFITVNLATALHDQVTWDCHADGICHASTLDDYRATLAPAFDQAFAALLDRLESSGMLESTLVIAQGEMGRTPFLNDRGGRDHWTRCWPILVAGGGVRGGQVIGASDAFGAEPKDRPLHAGQIFATILHLLGAEPNEPTPAAERGLRTDHDPIAELVG